MMLRPEPIWMSCFFFSQKKTHKFNLRFTTMCVTNGYTEVLEWWKEMELVQLFGITVQSPQRMVRMLDCLYEIGYQQAASYVKEVSSGGQKTPVSSNAVHHKHFCMV
jgi:hypothetical protein